MITNAIHPILLFRKETCQQIVTKLNDISQFCCHKEGTYGKDMLVSIPGTAEEKNLVALPLPLKLCSSGRHDFFVAVTVTQ